MRALEDQHGDGWVYHLLIYLFVCWSYRMTALRLYYRLIAPNTCKDDISDVLFVIFESLW